jgi:hypothetical protein
VHVDKVERVQIKFIRYALRSLGWTDIYDLPPYEYRYALLHLETLVNRRSIACIMFLFDILSGRMNSPNLVSAFDLNIPRYRTTRFMNRCLPQCTSLTRSFIHSVISL